MSRPQAAAITTRLVGAGPPLAGAAALGLAAWFVRPVIAVDEPSHSGVLATSAMTPMFRAWAAWMTMSILDQL